MASTSVGVTSTGPASLTRRRASASRATTPRASDLWRVYLNEAEGALREYGVEQRSAGGPRRGRGIPLFFLGFNAAGRRWRASSPRTPREPPQTAIMDEMGGSSEVAEIGERSTTRYASAHRGQGRVEQGRAVVGVRLVQTISRSVTHAMTWLGAEFAIAAIREEHAHRRAHRRSPVRHRGGSLSRRPLPHDRGLLASRPYARALDPRAPAGAAARGRRARSRGWRRVSSPIDPATRTHAWRPLILDVSEPLRTRGAARLA